MKIISGCLILLSFTFWSVQAFDWQEGNNGRIKWANNCDYRGADIESERSTGAKCGTLCLQKSSCTRFAWTHHDGGTCWLKSGNGDAFYVANGGACGYVIKERNAEGSKKRRKNNMSEDIDPSNKCKNPRDCLV